MHRPFPLQPVSWGTPHLQKRQISKHEYRIPNDPNGGLTSGFRICSRGKQNVRHAFHASIAAAGNCKNGPDPLPLDTRHLHLCQNGKIVCMVDMLAQGEFLL